MLRRTIPLLLGEVLLIAAAPPLARGATMATAALPEPLAAVAGRPIPRAEIEAELGPLPPELDHAGYEILEKAVERAVERRLFEVEAASRGLEPAALLELEVEGRLSAPAAREVRSYWQANRAHLEPWGAEVAEEIRLYLIRQQRLRRRTELLAELRQRHPVEVRLGPFRVEVASEGHPARGPAGAAVTLVVFSDFECEACSELAATLERLAGSYGDDLRLVFRQLPAAGRAGSRQAAEASLCAHELGRFWAMHDLLFGRHAAAPGADRPLPPAAAAGLDEERFRRCLESGRVASRVEEDAAAGRRAGAAAPPAIFVNGRLLVGAVPYSRLAGVVEDELAAARAAH